MIKFGLFLILLLGLFTLGLYLFDETTENSIVQNTSEQTSESIVSTHQSLQKKQHTSLSTNLSSSLNATKTLQASKKKMLVTPLTSPEKANTPLEMEREDIENTDLSDEEKDILINDIVYYRNRGQQVSKSLKREEILEIFKKDLKEGLAK